MNLSTQLPKSIEKTINDLARAREKAAKQKYLIDLGESLVMYLCSFTLGEYKEQASTSLDLEKSFIKNSKNVSFGIYLGWLREGSKFLNQEKTPSRIHLLLHAQNDLAELSVFIKVFEKLKNLVEENDMPDFSSIQTSIQKENFGKTNLLQFFDVFIQLRNRIAHPNKEVKGRIVSWPFSEDYFDAINPYIEQALARCIKELNKIWEFRQYIVESNEDGLLTLKDEDSDELQEFEMKSEYKEGVKVFANPENMVLLSDWKLLLRAGDEAIAKIKAEEDELRNKASVDELKIAIRAALDDQQISLEEMNFFESLGKTKLGLGKEDIKKIIIEVANSMDIEDPFPEVDKRFIEAIDNAIISRTYNEFLLKLTGQQYGVDGEKFEEVFRERTFALGANADEIRKYRVLQFTSEELIAFQGLMSAQKWLMSIYLFRKLTKESIYKIKEDSYTYGTKEYFHRNAFLDLEKFVKTRLKKLIFNEDSLWETKQNNWQIGAMTGYAWCTLYPKNLASKKILALHVSLYGDGSAAIGYLPDWKDFKEIEKYGLLLNIFTAHLKEFAQNYSEDLKKYPKLLLWDRINEQSAYSFNESMQHPWIYDHVYDLEQIQFVHDAKEIVDNPSILIDSFDISFNLFNGLFDEVNRDYQNLLNFDFEIELKEAIIRKKLSDLQEVFSIYGLSEKVEDEHDKASDTDDSTASNNLEVDTETPSEETGSVMGSSKKGRFYNEFRAKVKGYPLQIVFQFKQDYLRNQLNYSITISCAGYLQPEIHLAVEHVLKSLQDLQIDGTEFYFMRSKLLAVQTVSQIETFDPIHLTQYLLDNFANRCAFSSVPFLGLKVNRPDLQAIEFTSNSVMDELNATLQSGFGNQIYKQRDWMKGYRYIDYVYSAKTVVHWLGWGLEWNGSECRAGIIFHIANALKGASLKEQIEKLVASDKGWEMLIKGESDSSTPFWILAENKAKFLSSSDYNRNYTAKQGYLENKNKYWCAAKQDTGQWWQIEVDTPLELVQIKLAGAPHGKNFVRNFDLAYSVDGKLWNTLENIDGLENGDAINSIDFDSKINFRFLRICPKDFQGWPGLRADVSAREIKPHQIEAQWMISFNHSEEFKQIMNRLPEKITEILQFKGVGI
jgi:hypothetical protein